MSAEKTKAAVCYCLFADRAPSEGMSELLYWCQDLFEHAAFRELYQGFAVGRNISFALPMQEYPLGFRGVLDENSLISVYRENLVLSYEILRSFMEENVRMRSMAYYLVLLVPDKRMGEDKNLLPILRKFGELKEKYELQVCCIGLHEGKLFRENSMYTDLVDISGANGMKML